jgi:hypothetical protein
MLPDGAEKHLEDWTIFFLNQTPFNMIEPVLALETPDSPGKEDKSELLYVLNLVRTKHDKSVRRYEPLPCQKPGTDTNHAVRRGAVVKAMAICTPHPFIQIFKVRHCTRQLSQTVANVSASLARASPSSRRLFLGTIPRLLGAPI